MERELFRRLYLVTYHSGKTRRTRHVVFPDWKIVMTYFWAVLHDRPVAWACQAQHWPVAARDVALPSASTMSRRLRRPAVTSLLEAVEHALRRAMPRDRLVFIDAKPLPIGNSSKDPDARMGYGNGRLVKGYKLHAICDEQHRLVAWTVRPMNEREPTVAPGLVTQLQGRGLIVGDNAYDANPLYDVAGRHGWQLVAPRREGTSLGKIRHSPWRLIAHQQMPASQRESLLAARKTIERFFGQLGNVGFGLGPLPNWVRRLSRVRLWVHAKLILHLTSRLLRTEQAA